MEVSAKVLGKGNPGAEVERALQMRHTTPPHTQAVARLGGLWRLSVMPFEKKRFYLYIFRERGREGERGTETSMCGCLSRTPHWEPGWQPRHVP